MKKSSSTISTGHSKLPRSKSAKVNIPAVAKKVKKYAHGQA